MDSVELLLGELVEHFRIRHLGDGIVGALGEGHVVAHVRTLHVVQKLLGERRDLRVIDHRGDLHPDDTTLAAHGTALRRDAAHVGRAVQARRRSGVGAAGAVEIDLAVDEGQIHLHQVVGQQLGALEPLARGLLEGIELGLGVLLERVDACADGHVHDVPVVVGEDAVFARVARLVEEIEALVLGGGAGKLIGVHHEVERAEALRHAEEIFAVAGQRPFVGRTERLHHLLHVRLERIPRDRLDQLFRIHLLARPWLVEVDQVPHADLAGTQLVDHVGIRGAGLGLHRGAGHLAEGIEHLVGVVALPAKDVELILPSREGPPRHESRRRGHGGRAPGNLEETATTMLVHDGNSSLLFLSEDRRAERRPANHGRLA